MPFTEPINHNQNDYKHKPNSIAIELNNKKTDIYNQKSDDILKFIEQQIKTDCNWLKDRMYF